jgi:FtsH-binding integral membrane protein
MRNAYRALAGLLALGVVVQAALIAYATFSANGGEPAGGADAYDAHGTVGMTVLPVLGLVLLAVSFPAKVRGGVPLAVGLVVALVAEIGLAEGGYDVPALGAVHGVVALVIFALSVAALQRAKEPAPA